MKSTFGCINIYQCFTTYILLKRKYIPSSDIFLVLVSFLKVCVIRTGNYLKIIIIHLTEMLVVVWVIHLIQEVDSESPCQTRLGHKHMLQQTHKGYISS